MDKEKQRARQRRYYWKHREKFILHNREEAKKYYWKHREQILENSQKKRDLKLVLPSLEEKETKKKYYKQRWIKNRERFCLERKAMRLARSKEERQKDLDYARKYRLEHPEKFKEGRRKYVKKNRSNPQFMFATRLRRRVHHVLKGGLKDVSSIALLGCSFAEAVSHIEKQFKDGMTWENYGPVWHVDHIRPCASFDLSDLAQQRACFHFTNLQPLFAADNMSKGSKYVLE